VMTARLFPALLALPLRSRLPMQLGSLALRHQPAVYHLIFVPADRRPRPPALLGLTTDPLLDLETGLQVDHRVSRTRTFVPTS
jgi:hypothetical protein